MLQWPGASSKSGRNLGRSGDKGQVRVQGRRSYGRERSGSVVRAVRDESEAGGRGKAGFG